MGRDLKGKELGKNISQDKKGYYVSRFVDRNGKRVVKRFKKLQECRKWTADAMFKNEHSDFAHPCDYTVDAWYEQWASMREKEVKKGSMLLYRYQYCLHVKPVIGEVLLADLKPMHCQAVLNQMADEGYRTNTISLVRTIMCNIFKKACDNDLIPRNPCGSAVKRIAGKKPKDQRCLTIEEQKTFTEGSKEDDYGEHFAFVLQTGIRCGELSGLRWEDVNLKNRTVKIQRITEYKKGWYTDTPKTDSGTRTIPLTEKAVSILTAQKKKNGQMKVVPLEWKDNVFVSQNGNPVYNWTYNRHIASICKERGLPPFSIHALRHTFATRCIEAGMKPKTLQKILGHSTLAMTMDLYVHITEDEKVKEMDSVAHALSCV